jgi:hypothetical protein
MIYYRVAAVEPQPNIDRPRIWYMVKGVTGEYIIKQCRKEESYRFVTELSARTGIELYNRKHKKYQHKLQVYTEVI